LFGTEVESAARDLYSFECVTCGAVEVRGVQVKGAGEQTLCIQLSEEAM
jgi:hypothetical protein